MALTPQGYEVPSYRDIVERMEQTARLQFGATIDTNADSVLGHIIATEALEIFNIYQDIKALYDNLNPNTAEQKNLDRLCFLNNIIRKPASYSTATVTFTGTQGTEIPDSTIVTIGNSPVGRFITDNRVTIPSDQTNNELSVDVTVTCLTAGEVPVNINTIDSVEGLDGVTVTNNTAGSVGSYTETDAELRASRQESFYLQGSATVPAISSAISRTIGVTEHKIFTNRTGEPVPRGDGTVRPPHSTEVVVAGGSDEAVAKVLQQKTAAGLEYYGNTRVRLSEGNPLDVYFSRPEDIYPKIHVTPILYEEESLPADYVDQIKDNIVAFADSEYNLGKDLLPRRLVPSVLIEGVGDADIRITIEEDSEETEIQTVLAVADYERIIVLRENIIVV